MPADSHHPGPDRSADASPRPAHHFRSLEHQRDAATLGMWLFLATEVLLFSGLFCLYAVLRFNHPELFRFGSAFLDTGWGAINTVVLIVSSLTMAVAVRCAQSGQRRQTILFLALTLLCAVDFMGVKFIEYRHKVHEGLVWGASFYMSSAAHTAAPDLDDTLPDELRVELVPGDVEAGRIAYAQSCAGCHGQAGEGLANFGRPLATSGFVAERDDRALVRFLAVGRPVDDPLNTTGIAMLARGGDPRLTDQDLMDVAAHLRVLQERAGGATGSPATTASAPVPIDLDPVRTALPGPAPAPPGLATTGASAVSDPESARPANAHLFFGVYFLMTGLHGIHVLIGMVVILWLIVRTHRGDFSRRYSTPVDLGGLYWHVIDIIWIFLFPLLYLID